MGEEFTGKIVVVTGAASGMGNSVAEHFAQRGSRVLGVDRDETINASMAGLPGNGHHGIAIDLTADGVGLSGTASSEWEKVTVDDSAVFTGRLSEGAIATFVAARFATGRKNAFRVELSGSRGAVGFDLERMNELEFYDRSDPAGEQGFRRIFVTEPQHSYAAAWWPTGHSLGYEHAFSHQVRDLVTDIAEGKQPHPSFAEGLQVQTVLDAVERSAANRSAWTDVDTDVDRGELV